MQKPDFDWKWNTSQDKLVLSDFARYLVYRNLQSDTCGESSKDTYAKYFKPLLADYKSGKLTQLRHGNKLATYVDELERYLPKEVDTTNQDEIAQALEVMNKIKSYLVAYDDGLINAVDMVEALRKAL